jgi:hypothetical protein
MVLAISMLSAGPTSIYFGINAKVAKNVSMQSTWVRVYSPQPINQTEISAVTELSGVRSVIPAVLTAARLSTNGVTTSSYIYFVSSADAPSLFSMYQLDPTAITSQSGWLYFGAGIAQMSGLPAGKTMTVEVSGLGNMVAASSGAIQADSDFYIFGDIQAYWGSGGQAVSPGQYNYLFIVTTSPTAANEVGAALAEAHLGWNPFTPSDIGPSAAAANAAQLNLMLAFTSISWGLGFLVFVVYIQREVSSRSKELVTFAALGASRSALTKSISCYLLLLTTIGSILGLVLCLGVFLPWSWVLIYGVTYSSNLSSPIVYTVLTVMIPVLAFDAIIVVILRWRLGRLDMMSFLRSEV